MVDVCSNSTVSMVAKTHMVVYGLAHCYDQGMPINLLAPAHAHAAPPAGTWIRRESGWRLARHGCFWLRSPRPRRYRY